jgi:hypothetical protein
METDSPIFVLDTYGILAYLLRDAGGLTVKEKLWIAPAAC